MTTMDIARHISMIRSFRNSHTNCAEFTPYMIPNDVYHTNTKKWVVLPEKELLLVEVAYDEGVSPVSTEQATIVRQISDFAIEAVFNCNANGWQKAISATIIWDGTGVCYGDIWFSPFLAPLGMDHIMFQIGVIYGQLQFLSEPTIYADYIEPPPEVQQARQKRGKKPLPAYRIIRPGQTVMRHTKLADQGEVKGSPKSPHWNNGCTYTKQNGRVVTKRPYPVKGGKCPSEPLPVLVLQPNEVRFAV